MASAAVTMGAETNGVKQAYDAPVPDKRSNNNDAQLMKLRQEGIPFVMPSKRGIDPCAPGFDPDAFLDLVTEDVMFLQHQKLREILEVQADVQYLRRHGLNGRTDVESFRKCVPLVSYCDVEPDILRLVNGVETAPILTADPITNFSLSSGTTAGKAKIFPVTDKLYDYRELQKDFVCSLNRRDIPGYKGGKAMDLLSADKHEDTPSGIKAAGALTNFCRSPRFLNRAKHPYEELCVPDEVILCLDTSQSMYCHLLCALAQAPEVTKVASAFGVNIACAIRELQQQWPEIVADIRTGTVNPKITDPEMRPAVEKTVGHPNPALASRIERECSKEDWEGIIPRLFPNARFVECILSGTMTQYVPAVKHFSGHLPLLSRLYGTSECGIAGINIDRKCTPEDISYMLWPESAYFEFIPLDQRDGMRSNGMSVTILEAGDLEVGKEYELVVTNVAGLYRYRLGDVLRVKRFHNTVPVFQFVRRENVLLSVDFDKTDEEELQAVVNKACALLAGKRMEVSDYTSTVDISSLPGRYVIFFEMVDGSINLDHDVLQKCANTLDVTFNDDYRCGRFSNRIGPLELRIVREGTFYKVMALALKRGTARSQYKHPRFVNHPQALQVLKEGTVASLHSTITPDYGIEISTCIHMKRGPELGGCCCDTAETSSKKVLPRYSEYYGDDLDKSYR